MGVIDKTIAGKKIRWTPQLIKRLRGKRKQSYFGALVGATANTVRRWEVGRMEPDREHAKRLSVLAEREGFLKDWKLAGSAVLTGEFEDALRKQHEEIEQALDSRARSLRG
ncbi:MAG: hypothetical protein L0229_23795 [Blastocatellia bacterium]|nr:hypothetical protein [Blastocatellia bacterium]